MREILVFVEGDTEYKFIKGALYEYLLAARICVVPIVGGGMMTYGRFQKELKSLLGDRRTQAVTMMWDYYKFNSPYKNEARSMRGSCYERVSYVEERIDRDIDHVRFIPFLMLHEFETLAFVDTEQIARAFPDIDNAGRIKLEKIRRSCVSPEEINDGEQTAPSKRLKAIVPAYDKTVHGPLITTRIGIPVLRKACPHFDAWLKRLETFTSVAT